MPVTPGRATIVKRITADGLVELAENVALGSVRQVDLDSVREVMLFNCEWQKTHLKLVVDALCDHCGGSHQWLPCELLSIEARH